MYCKTHDKPIWFSAWVWSWGPPDYKEKVFFYWQKINNINTQHTGKEQIINKSVSNKTNFNKNKKY